MARRHQGSPLLNHPSLNCYKKHGCRCDGCTGFYTEAAQRRRENLSVGQQRRRAAERELAALNGTPSEREKKRAASRKTHPLSSDEVTRLRRAVGLIK